MSYSLNEVHMNTRKALVGRGLAFGVAEEFGAAAARLSALGLDGVAEVLAVDNEALMDILVGVEDAMMAKAVLASEPLPKALFAHLCGAPGARGRAYGIKQASWDKALELAQNTYVPESEASRLGGAGAGTNDND